MTKNIFKLLFKLLMVAFVITGICLTVPERMAEQFWFFTLQSNIFVAIIQLLLAFEIIMNMFGKKANFASSLTFSRLRILVTFFITITCLVYCFILAPGGIVFSGMKFSKMFDLRNVLLHIAVPIMAVADYVCFCPKGIISYKQIWLFLIYPLIYSIVIYLRVAFGGHPFVSGSYYPYFFFDPTHESQGVAIVVIYLIVMVMIFCSLALMYVWLDKKINKLQIRKAMQTKKPN